MSNPVEAENAVEMFDGWSIDNYELRVDLTQPRERRGSFQNLGIKDSSRFSPRRGYIHTL